MEMRKFIVEFHSDGRVNATEYEEPGERLDIRVEYEDQKENHVEKIIKAIEQRKETLQNRARRAAGCGDIESMRVNQNAALEDWLILRLIKHTIRQG